MKELINKFRKLSFENKTLYFTLISILLNIVLAVAKFIIAIIVKDVFFFVAGVFNIFIMFSKLFCYLGVKKSNDNNFFFHNQLIALFLFLSGFQYGIYMTRLVFKDANVMDYDIILGVMIACISFAELGMAIKGLFSSIGKGHYYRNMKLINLCSAFIAIVLTEIAIMSFASKEDTRVLNGLFGMCISIIIELIAIYVYFAPKISLVDRKHNIYKLMESQEKYPFETLTISLTNSKFYGNYTYIADVKENYIDGHIMKGKSPLLKMNIYLKIICIILSEILIFPYAIGALVFHFKCARLIRKLDEELLKLNYIKIKEEED